jgi:two-component system, NarL family, sensor kinase
VPHRARSRPDLAAAGFALAVATVGFGWFLLGAPERADDVPSFWAMPLTAALGYGAVGGVLAWAGRAVVVRRVMLGIALLQGLTTVTTLYGEASLDAGGEWPLTSAVYWLGTWTWAPAFVAVGTLLPLVLPDGRPLWRPATALATAAVGVAALSWALTPYHLQDVPIDNGLQNPVGIDVVADGIVADLSAALLLTAIAVSLSSLVVRWRRSRGVEREQLTWLLLGVAGTVLLALAGVLSDPSVGEVVAAVAMLPLPLACGVALLRHRLWDVDVVVSRSLAYGLLTGAVVGGYVAAVAVLGGLLGSTAGAPVLATAVVALCVLPLHGRLQRLVNRLVHGHDDDPYTALARLGGRLEAAADPAEIAEHVLPDLVQQVVRVLRVPAAAVVLSDGSRTAVGAVPTDGTRVPLVYAGTEVGALVVDGTDHSRSDRRLLDRLAQQAAVAAHSVLLGRDVARARAQAATAREEERRRLRRDLHDGMGPSLAALALQAETARDLVAGDPEAATALLDRLVPRLNEAVRDVRTLVHDLRPPTLDELGLAGALEELTNRFTRPDLPVRLHAGPLSAVPAAVDLAAYRIAGEALANAVRHAGARCIDVTVDERDGSLRLAVTDDGRGVDITAPAGVGLRSMRERAEELGGSLVVSPVPSGRGTTVTAVLPIDHGAVELPTQREGVLV